ncbi:hypothetical protein BC938DRAFT_473243 [Jimgerdemannia flammicorona]|uniref:Uncharacterized protein n=1 Tax=Jimgerdemannia flammicorona TaxID=994334 RepID=A0A433Q4H7_9FUNG|nr:hypothetical protein BC938DRAFT_473243 [Jimgerdemannia flammicorona]
MRQLMISPDCLRNRFYFDYASSTDPVPLMHLVSRYAITQRRKVTMNRNGSKNFTCLASILT